MKNLLWKNNTPTSPQFDDVYFSAHDGLAETQHVFLRGNKLSKRFLGTGRCASSQPGFTICELGFGTGLNFLAAFDLWTEQAQTGTLKFISCEKHPLSVADMEDVFANAQQKLPNFEGFLRKWEDLHKESCFEEPFEQRLVAGWHKLTLGQVGSKDGRKEGQQGELHLFVGDVRDMLSSMEAAHTHCAVDAWFLDGFAPAKNPDMWHTDIYQAMVRLSAPAATFATYTAAGHVRRGLANAGFAVWKEKGYGAKRDMTAGQLYANLKIQN